LFGCTNFKTDIAGTNRPVIQAVTLNLFECQSKCRWNGVKRMKRSRRRC